MTITPYCSRSLQELRALLQLYGCLANTVLVETPRRLSGSLQRLELEWDAHGRAEAVAVSSKLWMLRTTAFRRGSEVALARSDPYHSSSNNQGRGALPLWNQLIPAEASPGREKMAVAMQTKVSSRTTRAARAVSVRCEAGSSPRALPLAAATLAAAALVVGPSYAGVVMQKPALKKVFQEDAQPAPVQKALPKVGPPKSAPAVKAAAAPKVESGSSESGSVDPRTLALPASIVTVFGGFFALAKADKDFEKFLASTVIKDSSVDGVGYEELLKNGSFAGAGKAKAGTKKTGLFGKK